MERMGGRLASGGSNRGVCAKIDEEGSLLLHHRGPIVVLQRRRHITSAPTALSETQFLACRCQTSAWRGNTA